MKGAIMPRERIQHGKLYVEDDTVEPTPVIDDHGQPSGVQAHALRVYQPGEELPPGAKVMEMQSLDVAWRGDPGFVQISIEAPADWWDRFENSRKLGEQSHYGVYTAELSREEINKMIRTLRRARNAVFGSDE
ncbi:hypothetical protein SEA_FRANSOYER_23 [Microbacterium phage Fransoyer]|nr:hypothetical protein SEA_RUBYRALPH_23 [Microbacterium phage RubyRalph]UUG69588.1 hypothetical protein SEA_FRANSOYER_23 [Microbacterium phage Fransoyer]